MGIVPWHVPDALAILALAPWWYKGVWLKNLIKPMLTLGPGRHL